MGEATTWWENVMAEKKFQHGEVTWEEFLQLFRKRWLSQLYYDRKTTDFYKLVQGNMNVTQYHERFFHLVKYVPQYQHDELFRTQKFVMGL